MRDPKRIEKVLAVLRARWLMTPDLRLGQLLINLSADLEDLYFCEEDELVRRLTKPDGVTP